MFEFATRWLVCLVLLAVVVQSERTIKNMADNLFEERQAMLVWLLLWGGNDDSRYQHGRA